MNSPGLAEFACVSCRRLKRKCSKSLPTCSLCSRVGRFCDYQDPSATPERDRESPGRKSRAHSSKPARQSRDPPISTAHLGTPSSLDDSVASIRPARWFLDSVATRGSEMSLNRRLLWTDIIDHLPPPSIADARAIIDHYAVTSHLWFPVVSIKRLAREVYSNNEVVAADMIALLFTMRLLSLPPSDTSYSRYRAIKAALTECEQRNILSTDYCAAYVLLAVYEYGHGIFPVAYFTISHCARIFYCLGTHDKKKATQLFGVVDIWTETEERRRLWWGTMILDRMAHAGFRFRPLSTQTIAPDEIIPAADGDWDNGELTVNALLVMSIEANAAVGPFARTCQAAHLLGKVCEHVNEHPSAADADLHLEEAAHICRAVTAFKVLLDHDNAAIREPHRLITARAVCLSALHLMYDTHSCIEVDHVEAAGGNRGRRLELQQLAIDGSRAMSEETVDLAKQIEAYLGSHPAASMSPLVLNCLYAAAGTWAWRHRETGDEASLENLNTIRRVLGILRNQWQACNDYLGLLENTEITYTGACFQ